MATAATLSSFAATAPSAFAAGSQLRQPTSCRRLSSSFTGSQLAPVLSRASPAKQLEAQRHSRKSASVRAFIGGPGCGPRGGRYGGRGFYGRGSFPCGPQGVVVVPVPGMGTGMWPGYSPPDPEQFEQYQQRQKEAYEARRAVYEAQRAAWEVEAQKRRELREKQAAFFRKQQEELCREQQKWTQEYRDKGQQAGSTASVEAPPAPEQATQTETKEETKIEPEAPPRFPQSDTPVVHLRNEANGAEITLVGTAHISEASVEDVCNIIRSEKPDAVMVELDRKRYNRLVAASPEQQFLEEMMRLFVGAGMGPVGRLIGVGLMGFYRMLAYRGLQPGREFKVAIEEAKRVGAKVVLGDQDIDETLRNLEASMSPRDVQAFFTQPMPDDILKEIARDGPVGMGPGSFGPWGPLAGGRDTQAWVEKLKDRKIVRKLNSYMRRHAPALEKVMLQQRNAKMARALRHLEGKVVAVVGMAHLDGIEQLWQEQNDKVRQDRQAEVVEAEASAPVDVVDPAQNEVQLHLEDADVIDGVKEDTETAASTSSEAAVEEAAPTAASDDVQPSTEGERASAADEPGSTSEETRGSPNDEGKQDAPRANGEAVDQ